MRCEHCGHEQASGKFCDECGRMLTRVRLDEAESNDPGAATPAAAVRVRCHYCGNEQQGGRLCQACGRQLGYFSVEEEPEQKLTCPECGVTTSRQVCPNCSIRIPVREEEES